ncbi:VOC family protein [Pseudomarimonas salicorniae]|uniref:VOC family protein n=1 Tax=Pseudomarimonas salicorniae TaxID=2933270 RepID=A0ABT0GEC2_9GAMM|nr:VOC family protein [Lysobacter sp. CAU 1642]MCK7592900.1 VOC family protein [Lysobacter sp. CAU 1642]
MQHDVIEQVSFRARSAQAESRMAEAAWAAQPAMERLPGFVSRQFGRDQQGEWIDVVRWQSMAHAQQAAELAGRDPDIAHFFGQIDMESVRMRHFAAPPPAALWSTQPPVRQACPTLLLADFRAVRQFYERHFNARALFDDPRYLVLQLGGPLAPELHLMQPEPRSRPFAGGGILLNLQCDEVDALHARLATAQVPMAMPLEDHPWGDRGFSCIDPAGLELYCYSPRPMAESFLGGLREPWRIGQPAREETEDLEPA